MENSKRASDHNAIDIEDFIKGENDPKTRAFLMVMNSMNSSLLANTDIVRDIDKQLKAHLIDFNTKAAIDEAYINKGKGMWKVASWCLCIIQIAVLGFITNEFDEIKSLHSITGTNSQRLAIVEYKLSKTK